MWSKRLYTKTSSWEKTFYWYIKVHNHLSMLCILANLFIYFSFSKKKIIIPIWIRWIGFSLTSSTCHCKEEIKMRKAKGRDGTWERFQADAQCSVNLLLSFLFLCVTVSVSAFGAVVFECYDNWIFVLLWQKEFCQIVFSEWEIW